MGRKSCTSSIVSNRNKSGDGAGGSKPQVSSLKSASPKPQAPRATAASARRVSIVVPRLRGVRIAAHFPEPFAILREELDLADPLRAFPRVELRRDHPHR